MPDKNEATFFKAERGQSTGINHNVPEVGIIQSEQRTDEDFDDHTMGYQNHTFMMPMSDVFYDF